jgi:hypothetical protein
MTLRRTLYFALGSLLIIGTIGLPAKAQQVSQQDLNLTDAQVFRIQALLMQQSNEVRLLSQNVQAAQETLNAAVAKGDSTLTAMAVLSLDAAEKALKHTQLANQRSLLSLLNDSQKQAVNGNHSIKSIPASD